jgi:predicted GNAT superfamily acetyltransferase
VTHPGFNIRPLADYAEMKRAVEFQRVIWGSNFSELVPAVIFWAAARTGGIIAGAFEASGEMSGLIFGITGWDGSHPIHWSDMLGVHPAARGRGLGLALKRYQRDRLLEAGITRVNWTFDPLEARNAHINFARLGVTAREYIRDAYGASTSPLHRGIGTDRLVAEWYLDSPRVRRRMEEEAAPRSEPPQAPLVNSGADAPRLDHDEPQLWLRIPPAIQQLKERDAVAARRWREYTRAAFETYLRRGYVVTDLVRDEEGSRYLLEIEGAEA